MDVKAKRQLKTLKRARRKAEDLIDELIVQLNIAKSRAPGATDRELDAIFDLPKDWGDDLNAFRFLWRNIALADDATLTEDARKLKAELLAIVQPALEDAEVNAAYERARCRRKNPANDQYDDRPNRLPW
jgi:hypothetical protein